MTAETHSLNEWCRQNPAHTLDGGNHEGQRIVTVRVVDAPAR